ncbi:MAG: hypothetical protein CMP10_20745 [Zetaproteobacteria bacterium]|nr:hypothetical protein [Pseudobdellovibrionaceae bacterium]
MFSKYTDSQGHFHQISATYKRSNPCIVRFNQNDKLETKMLTAVHRYVQIWCTIFYSILFMYGCGSNYEDSDVKIVGGRQVTQSDLGPMKSSTVGLDGCTGSIVADDLIITAAHCYELAMSSGYVIFGTDLYGQTEIAPIEEGIVNASYTGPGDDLAMLRISGPLPAGFKPILMQPEDMKLFADEDVTLAGYGSTNTPGSFGVLRTVESKIKARDADQSIYVENGSTAACSGDSGGPLFLERTGEWYLVGVASTAQFNGRSQCTGGNNYVPIPENKDMINEMGRRLTGRNLPFPQAATQPSIPPVTDPEDKIVTDPVEEDQTPRDTATFGVTSDLLQISTSFRVDLLNLTKYPLSNCIVTLTLSRSNGTSLINYELEALIEESQTNEKHIVIFEDWMAKSSDVLGEVVDYQLRKTCDQS